MSNWQETLDSEQADRKSVFRAPLTVAILIALAQAVLSLRFYRLSEQPPGIYLPGVTGVRLEDAFLVTSDGAEQLSHHDKSLP